MTRPLFHFTARSGWINDPHGITYRDGGYDAFFQYVPDQTVWGPNCHWGHSRGPDLLSMVERAPAILPGDGDDGIWTGSLIATPHGPRIFYTAVSREALAIGRVRVAEPVSDDWDAWRKGPVVITAPEGIDFVGFRDPFLRRDPDAWRAFLGAGDTSGTALALSYRSDDLASWEYEGVALQRATTDRDPVWTGAMWECPQIFEIGDRFVMLSSAWDADLLHYAAYAIGTYEAGRFSPETWGRLTYGPSYYAPSFFRDAQGRPSLLLWMRGVEDLAAGWASAHSIPYLLSVVEGALVASPHPDLLRYRGAPQESGRISTAAADLEWSGAGDLTIEDDAGRPIAQLMSVPGEIRVHSRDQSWSVPRQTRWARIVIDHGVVEVITDRGLLGLPVDDTAGGIRLTGDDVLAFPLRREDNANGADRRAQR